jgi:serine/threonine-protein kinase
MGRVGGALDTRLGERVALKLVPWELVAEVRAVRALEHAHGQGVIHRHLKPGNIMLEESGRIRVADFGTVRVARDAAIRTGTRRMTRGTLVYTSPQQA